MSDETWRLDAVALGALLEAGAVTSAALVEQSLARIARFQPVLNAFTHVDAEGARAAAAASDARQKAGTRLGPLDGIPVSVKDNLFVKGMPACWGSLLFRDYVPAEDDICVERLRAAGAVIIGKTTTPEFALQGRTESRLSGITRNPWDPALTPGGSSGGAVASVAAGMVPLAVGTDAGGSTRMPAGYTGLVGMRPSVGRLARCHGFPPMAIDFQAIGPFARSMRDMDLLYAALAGPDPRDPASARVPAGPVPARPRIGWFTAIGNEGATPEVAAAVRTAVESLGGGAEVAAPYDLALLREVWGTLTAAGAARVVARFPDRWRDAVTDQIRGVAEHGLVLPATGYVEALDRLAVFRSGVTANWGDYDALVIPTGAAPAWKAEEETPPGLTPATQGMFCGWVNAAGLASISVPGAPHPDGRPIGVQIVAPFGGDALVLELARRLERAAPWVERWPALAGY